MARLAQSGLLCAASAVLACGGRPSPELIALTDGRPVSAIAPAGNDIYWSVVTVAVDVCAGILYRTNLRSHETAAIGGGCVTAIAVVGDSVWWSESAVGISRGELWSMPLAGGPPVMHASGAAFEGLAFDAANVYVGQTVANSDSPGAQIVAYPRDGGAPVVVESVVAPPPLLAVSGASLFWLSPSSETQPSKPSINRASVNGGVPEIFVAGATPTSFAIDSSNLYWTQVDPSDSSAGSLVKLPLAGGPPVVLASGFANPGQVVVAGNDLYWLSSHGSVGTLLKASVVGGAVETLEGALVFGSRCSRAGACGLPTPLAVDDTYVYYAAGAGLHRVHR
jgi:hypothetical protein